MIEQAIALHKAGDIEAAEKAYRELLAAEPENFEALHFLALIRQDAGALDEALDLTEKAIELQPEVGTYHATLGGIRYAQGDLPAARANYEHALSLNPNLPEGHNTLGFLQLQMGEPETAEKTLNTALRLDPDSVSVHANLAQVALALGRVDEAVNLCQRALSIDPKSLPARATLAEALLAQGAFAIAEQAFRTCLTERPGVPAWQAGLANTLVAQQRAEEARAVTHEGLANHPRNPVLRAAAGHAALALSHWHDAADHFQQSLLARPGHHAMIEGLGDALWARGELEQARQCFEAVPTPASRVKAMSVAAELGDAEAATAGLGQMLADNPGDMGASLALASVQAAGDDLNAALATAESSLGTDGADGAEVPRNAVALLAAELALKLGQPDRAVSVLKHFVANRSSDRDGALAREFEARAMDQAGDYAAAATAFQGVTREVHIAPVSLPVPELPPALENPVDDGREPPVVLTGAPGSGVNLLARMLSGGQHFDVLEDRFIEPGQRRDFLDSSAERRRGKRSPEEQHRLERRAYWNAAERRRDHIEGRVLALDVVPMTQARIGALASYFPGATVILAVRHPADLLLHARTLGWRDGLISADTLLNFYRSVLDVEGVTLLPVNVGDLPAGADELADALAEPLAPLTARYEITLAGVGRSRDSRFTDHHLPNGQHQHYRENLALLNPSLSQLAGDLGF